MAMILILKLLRLKVLCLGHSPCWTPAGWRLAIPVSTLQVLVVEGCAARTRFTKLCGPWFRSLVVETVRQSVSDCCC